MFCLGLHAVRRRRNVLLVALEGELTVSTQLLSRRVSRPTETDWLASCCAWNCVSQGRSAKVRLDSPFLNRISRVSLKSLSCFTKRQSRTGSLSGRKESTLSDDCYCRNKKVCEFSVVASTSLCSYPLTSSVPSLLHPFFL